MPKRVGDVVVQTTTTLFYWIFFLNLDRVVQELQDEFDRQAVLVVGKIEFESSKTRIAKELVL